MKRAYILFLVTLFVLGRTSAADEVKTSRDGLTLNGDPEATETWPTGPVVMLTHGTLAHRGMEIISGLQAMLADGEKIELVVLDGADHFFRDLYSEEIADALAERVGE